MKDLHNFFTIVKDLHNCLMSFSISMIFFFSSLLVYNNLHPQRKHRRWSNTPKNPPITTTIKKIIQNFRFRSKTGNGTLMEISSISTVELKQPPPPLKRFQIKMSSNRQNHTQ